MTTELRIFSDDAMAALRRDHERLRLEVQQLRIQLRALHSELEGSGRRPICRFELDADMDSSTSSAAATILAQFGPGVPHVTTAIIVQNEANGVTTLGNYRYYGETNQRGWAFWDPHTRTWRIFDLDCPIPS